MVKAKRYGSVKRFGARYGKKVKDRLARIEQLQKQKYKCPYCNAVKVKRLAAGVWYCTRCKAKFTSKAYTVVKPVQAVASHAMAKEL